MSPGAVAAWVLVQVGCLALGWGHVPLTAQSPPGDAAAPELLIGGQVAAAAALCGLLFRTAGTAAVVVASAWPGLVLAGGLAARPPGDVAAAGLIVSAWLLVLGVATWAVPPGRSVQVLAAAASLWAVGGPLLAYLATEFGPADAPLPGYVRTSPALLAWQAAAGSPPAAADLFPMGVAVATAAVVLLVATRRRHEPPARP